MSAPTRFHARLPRRHLEHESQALLFRWAELASLRCPELRMLFAIPNWAGVKGPRDGAMRKREGVKAGVPDLCLPVSRGGFGALWIEMKSPTGRPTKDQRAWMEALRAEGYAVHLCHSTDEARAVIERYLSLPKGRG